MKKILLLVIFLLFFAFVPTQAFADSDFQTSYQVNYEVNQNGETEVTQKISLKNLTDRFFVSSFNLTIGSTTVTDVQAFDDKGKLPVQTDNKGNKTSITINLPQPVAGTGKIQSFTLKFKSKDFAESLGKTWEVNLPKIPNSSDIEDYDLNLSVPIGFGDLTSMSPVPSSQSTSSTTQNFEFTKDQLQTSGVSMSFGSSQVFDFNLGYHLTNQGLFPSVATVSLPPDTNYQDIEMSQINPKPDNVTIDQDGNYLAWYKLNGKEQKDIRIQGKAKLYIRPKENSFTSLDQSDINVLTKPEQYWESDNPSIKAVLSEIFKNGEPRTVKEKAKLIYRYVVDNLKYDDARVNSNDLDRLGAVTVLNNPSSAVCMEFTDLFVALARAAQIPARELEGYAYSQNRQLRPLSLSKDLLHAWPEYFDPNVGWVMVDPTWENTSGGVDYFNKFDLNHLVLAIHGTSSIYPQTSDDVKVELAKEDFKAQPQVDVRLNTPQSIWAGLPSQVTLVVANSGTEVQPPLHIQFSTNKQLIQGVNDLMTGPIPPNGNVTYSFNLKSDNLLSNYQEKLKAQVGNQEFERLILVKSFFAFDQIPYILGILLAFIFGGYLIVLGTHIYRKRVAKS